MLKGFGKLTKMASSATLSAGTDEPPRSVTPTPGNPEGKPTSRTGLLTIRVLWAEGLVLPPGTPVPPVVQAAFSTQQAKVAASVSPSSVMQKRLAKRHSAKDSIQRTQCWWLPYLVMEFEVNQVLITALGGELEKPLYMYQAQLSVPMNSPEVFVADRTIVMCRGTPRFRYNATFAPNNPRSAMTAWPMTWAMIYSWAVSSSYPILTMLGQSEQTNGTTLVVGRERSRLALHTNQVP